jgi:uncharacterized protein (TIGR00297 family)
MRCLTLGWLISSAQVSRPYGHFAIALAITLAFAGLARAVRGVSSSGAVAGAAVCFLLCAYAGPGAFAALALVFVLAWATTRLGYQRKQKLGTAERREGRRASQVLANLGVPAICSVIYGTGAANPAFLMAMAASLAEAAADTVSSEFGQAAGRTPRLITTWKPVPVGTNGGVSLAGTLAGIVAAALVSLICLLIGLLDRKGFAISTGAGVLGMAADSLLGASLERRRRLNNDAVNFLGTLIAALTAFLLAG